MFTNIKCLLKKLNWFLYSAIYCNCYAWTYCKYKVWFWRIFKCKSSFNISMGYYNALWLPLWPFNLLLVWSDKTKNRAAKIFDFWCVRIRFLLWLVRILRLSKNCLWINKYSVLMSHTTRKWTNKNSTKADESEDLFIDNFDKQK